MRKPQSLLSCIASMITDPGHAPLPTAGAVHRRRSHAKIRNRSCDFVLGTIFLVLLHPANHLGLTVLRSWTTLMLLRRLLAVHLLLLLVGIMWNHGCLLLLLVAHATRLLLVHHWLLLSVLGHGRRLHWWWGVVRVATHHWLRSILAAIEVSLG
jgi:hypothetical protein